MQNVFHKYRILDSSGFLNGARIINGVDSDRLILEEGDFYVIDNKAFKCKASFLYTLSGLTCYLYILEPDQDLQDIINIIGLQ